jgi:hypothetical protein
MQNEIYVVTYGQYSSYAILGVYTTREQADIIASKMEDGRVEVFPLNDYADMFRDGRACFCVHMYRDGTSKVYKTGPNNWTMTSPQVYPQLGGKLILVYTWADNEQHAVKIANEYRALRIASGDWLSMTTWEK